MDTNKSLKHDMKISKFFNCVKSKAVTIEHVLLWYYLEHLTSVNSQNSFHNIEEIKHVSILTK